MPTTPPPSTKSSDQTRAESDEALAQATAIFQSAWSHIESRVESGAARLPREIIWLGGAPGAGKGTNTPFILRERGIAASPIVTSDLLNAPERATQRTCGCRRGPALERLWFATTGVARFPRTRSRSSA
jgi:adenylate kinase